MRYTRRFDEIGRGDIAVAGGKGANLGELSRAGFPVPPGFVLTTAAYDAFVVAADIRATIVELAAQPQADDLAGFDTAAAKIRTLFTGAAMPEQTRAGCHVIASRPDLVENTSVKRMRAELREVNDPARVNGLALGWR